MIKNNLLRIFSIIIFSFLTILLGFNSSVTKPHDMCDVIVVTTGGGGATPPMFAKNLATGTIVNIPYVGSSTYQLCNGSLGSGGNWVAIVCTSSWYGTSKSFSPPGGSVSLSLTSGMCPYAD